jgi:hypothetical protein
MTRRRQLSTASLFVALGGGLFLSTPARADDGAYTCRDSVRAYCQWVADNYCTTGAVCTYEVATCTIVDAECY